jgi:hypothetical protein
MAQFDVVLSALVQGQSVRRDEWEPIIRMFVLRDTLMCQCGDSKPWQYALSWDEITALDWQLIKATSSGRPTSQTSASRGAALQIAERGDSFSEVSESRRAFSWFFPKRWDISK